jgi:hypothetical protein
MVPTIAAPSPNTPNVPASRLPGVQGDEGDHQRRERHRVGDVEGRKVGFASMATAMSVSATSNSPLDGRNSPPARSAKRSKRARGDPSSPA